MRTLKKLWLVGILLVPVGLQTRPAEAQQCQSAYDFATFSEDVCASVCSQWGCNGYRFTGEACYCTHPTGGGGPFDPPQDSLLQPPASLAANPPAHGAAAIKPPWGGAWAIAPKPSLRDKFVWLEVAHHF
jgi:hypothetical protein